MSTRFLVFPLGKNHGDQYQWSRHHVTWKPTWTSSNIMLQGSYCSCWIIPYHPRPVQSRQMHLDLGTRPNLSMEGRDIVTGNPKYRRFLDIVPLSNSQNLSFDNIYVPLIPTKTDIRSPKRPFKVRSQTHLKHFSTAMAQNGPPGLGTPVSPNESWPSWVSDDISSPAMFLQVQCG